MGSDVSYKYSICVFVQIEEQGDINLAIDRALCQYKISGSRNMEFTVISLNESLPSRKSGGFDLLSYESLKDETTTTEPDDDWLWFCL